MKKTETFHSRVTRHLTRERGASLLEGIAYLGIAAIVVLGAVSLLTNAFGSAKANQATEEIVALRTAVRKLYAGQAFTGASLVANLITANAIPNTLAINRTNNTVTNGWAGGVTIIGNVAGTFTITYPNLPQDVCIGIVSGSNGWTLISNGTAANDITVFPATVANATAVCPATTNNISFTAT